MKRGYHHATAKYLGGTVVAFTCKDCGHSWKDDMQYPNGKRLKHIRLSESAVAMLAQRWERSGDVIVGCPKCDKAR